MLAPKMVNFAPKTKGNVHVWDSLPYPTRFFTPTPRVFFGGLSYADFITNFSGVDSFPFSFREGAPLRALRARMLR